MKKPELADPHMQELFGLYAFMTAVNENMLRHFTAELNAPEFGELLGMMTLVGSDIAKLMIRVREIEKTHPRVYYAWAGAVREARENEQTD